MADYPALACQHLGVSKSQIVRSRVDEPESELVVLVDYGIGGIKKLRLSLADIDSLSEEGADADLSAMTVAELREMVAGLGVEGYKAMKKADLIAVLEELEAR